jgi:uncharacterized protein VirK/YbjX
VSSDLTDVCVLRFNRRLCPQILQQCNNRRQCLTQILQQYNNRRQRLSQILQQCNNRRQRLSQILQQYNNIRQCLTQRRYKLLRTTQQRTPVCVWLFYSSTTDISVRLRTNMHLTALRQETSLSEHLTCMTTDISVCLRTDTILRRIRQLSHQSIPRPITLENSTHIT